MTSTPRVVLRVVGAAIVRGDRCLVARRGAGVSSPGRWEFPGGKVEAGERPEEALVREVREELGVEIALEEHLGRGEAMGSRAWIVLDVWLARLVAGEPHPVEHDELRWVGGDELATLDWLDADLPILPAVRAALRRADPRAR